MAAPNLPGYVHAILMVMIICCSTTTYPTVYANFYNDIDVTWSYDNVNMFNNGQDMQLSLNNVSGSAFQSKEEFLFGSINMLIRFGISIQGGVFVWKYQYVYEAGAWKFGWNGYNILCDKHDEVDMEFLGNVSGQPYILHTNIYTQGSGSREQQFYLWFDPTADFHNYSILWNPKQILFSVDGLPIRVFGNNEDIGVPYANEQAMRVYSSIWNGDNWATEGGRVKIDWSYAPFVASYTNFTIDACQWEGTGSPSNCWATTPNNWWNQPAYGA